MVLRVKADIDKMRGQLTRMQRQQIPYAASVALNTVAFDTRQDIIKRVWPQSFRGMRNPRFPSVLFRVDKASKGRLSSAVYQDLPRDWVQLHITGGIRRPIRASTRAVPVGARRTATGRIRSADKPRTIKGGFITDLRGRGPALWKKLGKDRLQLMFVLRPSVNQRRIFPFYKEGYRYAERRWPGAFSQAVERALRTARR
jgi:hypothetical protein